MPLTGGFRQAGQTQVHELFASPSIGSSRRAEPGKKITQSTFICNLGIGHELTENNIPPSQSRTVGRKRC